MHVPRPVAVRWSDIESQMPFSEQELLDDVARLRDRHRVCAVYVGGSRADGYGNVRSDVDVYVLVEEPVEPISGGGYVVSCVRGQHIQYDFVTTDFVENAVAQLREGALDRVSLSRVDLKVLHRLCNSVVVSGDDVVSGYRERLLNAGFARLCAHRKAIESENGIQDAYGAWDSGHNETAIYMLRTTVQFAFDALVSLRGETANNDKWIFPRSVRAFGSDHVLCLRFRSLYQQIPNENNPDDVAQYFQRSFRFVQVCLDALCASAMPVTGDVAPPHEVNSLIQRVLLGLDETVPSRKSPHAYLRCINGKYLLHNRGRPRQELGERAAVLWLCVVGRQSPAETASAAMRLRPDLFQDEAHAMTLADKVHRGWVAAGHLLY
jgi:hypothetical protein